MKKIRLKITVFEKSQKSRFYREKREKYKKIHHIMPQNHDTMSVSEREQTKFVHRERRMAIMIAAKAASSTEGANHDIIACGPKMYRILKYI